MGLQNILDPCANDLFAIQQHYALVVDLSHQYATYSNHIHEYIHDILVI